MWRRCSRSTGRITWKSLAPTTLTSSSSGYLILLCLSLAVRLSQDRFLTLLRYARGDDVIISTEKLTPFLLFFVFLFAIQFVRSLADVDHEGKIKKVHENRIAPLIANILVGVSIFLLNVLRNLPVATLDGLFLFMGVGGLVGGNQLAERIAMLLSEPKSHHPTFYRKHVPLSRIHAFTFVQLVSQQMEASSSPILPVSYGIPCPGWDGSFVGRTLHAHCSRISFFHHSACPASSESRQDHW